MSYVSRAMGPSSSTVYPSILLLQTVHCKVNVYSFSTVCLPIWLAKGYIKSIYQCSCQFSSANLDHATCFAQSCFNMYATLDWENLGEKTSNARVNMHTECILMNSVTPFHVHSWPHYHIFYQCFSAVQDQFEVEQGSWGWGKGQACWPLCTL